VLEPPGRPCPREELAFAAFEEDEVQASLTDWTAIAWSLGR
jgi:hypothetical protein